MNRDQLKELLQNVADGKTGADDAAQRLQNIFFEDLGFACLDHHRSLRKGFPEVIYGEGKTVAQVIGIMERMEAHGDVILATRLSPEKGLAVIERFPLAVYHEDARMVILEPTPLPKTGRGPIAVVAAGTSDMPVAREASLTARAMGNEVSEIYDVGVAGLHRLFIHKEALSKATVIVVAAGMEGALPSVVAGLFPKPVIAVPTSVGYGASFGGVTALLSMLNSCASNVAVVNVDNGFGAGYMASIINHS
ncbi:MAG: nickel pincer cofactor biosynthesis protein LarB [Deltaproteobacteria bacterium]|nr:nickel pincer cofactor biosynthesis protein LarB [Deltaproteobacteria bacterium]